MSELAVTTTSIVHPATKEIFDLENPNDAARAVTELKDLEGRLTDMRRAAEHALVEESRKHGSKTLRYPHGDRTLTVEISGGPGATGIDCLILRAELTKAGCPEERINEAIKEEITYKADRGVCRQLAGANPDYKLAVAKATYTFEKRYSVRVG